MSVLPNFVAIDTECTGLNPWKGARMFAAAAVFPSGRTLYWRDDFGGLKELLEDASIDKVFQNAKFDLRMLEWAGFEVKGQVWDTMILAHLADASQRLALEHLAVRYLAPSRRKVVEELNVWFDEHKIKVADRGKNFGNLPPELLRKRCISDTTLTALLFQRLYPVISKEFPLLIKQEHELLPVVKKMEDRGMLIDLEEVARQREYMSEVTEQVVLFCEGILGHGGFNINSKAHLCDLLKRAGVLDQITERTPKTHEPQLTEQVLRGLHHPVAHMILLGKKADALDSKFLRAIQKLHVDSVVHAQFNQLGTCTGRFSCSKPNLENQPTEGGHLSSEETEEAILMTGTDLAPRIKRCFPCRPGFTHLHADKSKVEVLMLAHYTRDPMLLEVMTSGLDIHEEMSMRMFGEATKGLRVRAKVTVFGFQYGVGDEGLAKKIRCTVAEAKSYKERLQSLCPTIQKFKRDLRRQISERGYVCTDHGRRHYLRREQAYMAVNRMCQGTAADEVKSRMIVLNSLFQQHYTDCSILLNIHDDIGSEIPTELVPEIAETYHNIVEEVSIPFALPLPASLESTTTTWAELKDYPLGE